MALRKRKESEMAKDEQYANADFVGRVVGDPKNPTPTRLLTGWFGDASESGYRRLYTDAQLSSYVDIPTDGILSSEPIRDSQPPGGVFVWIKADAAVKQGGTAASRAARFLQGQVERDFSTPEKAGYRCITQPPCAEPTGFSGLCTKQPDVGNAWPCITAIPLCHAEPTGFTGKCTHQPWPNPTKYIGCTIYHCPTQDLTHIPWICNIVATGMPGCGVEPPAGGGEQKAGAAAVAAAPTKLPGCGYTQSWGLCNTQLPKCQVSVDNPCITQTEMGPRCIPTADVNCVARAAGGGAVGAPAPTPPISVTMIVCCNPSAIDACPTHFHCPTPATQCTQGGPECATHNSPNCPTHNPCCTQAGPHCPTHQFECTMFQPQCPKTHFGVICTGIQCIANPDAANFGAQAAARPAQPQTLLCTPVNPCGGVTHLGCTQFGPQCPSAVDACPTRFCGGGGGGLAQFGAALAPNHVAVTPFPCSAVDACVSTHGLCETKPPTQFCTQIPEGCPTWCGPNCQSQAPCTPVNCTHAGVNCPDPSVGFLCTIPPNCPQPTLPPQCPGDTTDCTFGCTQIGTGCPQTPLPNCAIDTPNVNAQQFGAAWGPILGPTGWQGCHQTSATVCTQIGHLCRSAVDACPTRLCGGGGQQFAAAPAVGAAAGGGGFGVTAWLDCTQFGPQCGQFFTLFEVQCQVIDPWATRIGPQCFTIPPQCPRTVVGCPPPTPDCPRTVWQCPPPTFTPLCPPHSRFIACTVFGPQCGGGGTIAQQFAAAPAAAGAAAQPAAAGRFAMTSFNCPTPATHCFWCPPDFGNAAAANAIARPFQTRFIECFNQPTPATRCFWCPPATFGGDCGGTIAFAQFGGQQPRPTPATECFPNCGLQRTFFAARDCPHPF